MNSVFSRSSANNSPLSFVSLYSGAGGLDLGFAKAGVLPVFANDIDKSAVLTPNSIHLVQDLEWIEAAKSFSKSTAIARDIMDVEEDLVEEAAALQTFPYDLKWEGSQSAQYRRIGNAVPPRLSFIVAKALQKVFSES